MSRRRIPTRARWALRYLLSIEEQGGTATIDWSVSCRNELLPRGLIEEAGYIEDRHGARRRYRLTERGRRVARQLTPKVVS